MLKKQTKLYYKVVRSSFYRGLISVGTIHSQVQYKVNEWVAPDIKDSYLFCFDSLNAAKDFVGTSNNREIWTCQIDRVIKPPMYVSYADSMNKYWDLITHLKKKKKSLSRWNVAYFAEKTNLYINFFYSQRHYLDTTN